MDYLLSFSPSRQTSIGGGIRTGADVKPECREVIEGIWHLLHRKDHERLHVEPICYSQRAFGT